jgi:hypothetical protein
MQLIRECGDRSNNPDDRTGYGIPNFYQCYLDHTNRLPENKRSAIAIYPNPTMGELRIMNYELEIKSVEIYDVYGRKLSSHPHINSSSHPQIKISNINSGIYFVMIITEEGEVVKKVVKQ